MNDPNAKILAAWKTRRTLMRADYEKSKETLPHLAEFLKRERDRLDTDPLTLDPVITVNLTPLKLAVHRAAASVWHAPRAVELSIHLENGVEVKYSDDKPVQYAGIAREGSDFKLVSRGSNGTTSHTEFLDVWNAWLLRALTHEPKSGDDASASEGDDDDSLN